MLEFVASTVVSVVSTVHTGALRVSLYEYSGRQQDDSTSMVHTVPYIVLYLSMWKSMERLVDHHH